MGVKDLRFFITRRCKSFEYIYWHKKFCLFLDSIDDLENAIVKSKNPVLKGIVDYLIEETSAEEEALLGVNGSEDTEIKVPLETDKNMLKVLL